MDIVAPGLSTAVDTLRGGKILSSSRGGSERAAARIPGTKSEDLAGEVWTLRKDVGHLQL